MRRGPEDSKVGDALRCGESAKPSKCGANLAAGLPHFIQRRLFPMLIRLDDANLVDDFCDHYRRSGFDAELVGGGRVEVVRPDAPTSEQERYEVLLHLRVWEAVNPEARGELLL
jgi:hypothetical protein